MSDSTPTTSGLHRKLAEVMAELENLEKRGWNDFHKYHYLRQADVADAIRRELGARGVTLIPRVSSWERTQHRNDNWLWTVEVVYTFTDAESGETLEVPWVGVAMDKDDKGLYKALTGANKYLLLESFCLSADDDPEATQPDAGGVRQAPARQQNRGNAQGGRGSTGRSKAGSGSGGSQDPPGEPADWNPKELEGPTAATSEQRATIDRLSARYRELKGDGIPDADTMALALLKKPLSAATEPEAKRFIAALEKRITEAEKDQSDTKEQAA